MPLFAEADRNLQAEEHASRIAVKDGEAGHDLADVVPRNPVAMEIRLSFAIFPMGNRFSMP